MDLNKFIKEVTETSVKNWDGVDRSFGDYIALMHAELSEALEEYRNERGYSEIWYDTAYVDNEVRIKPEGIPIELADVIIRIFSFCGRYEIDIEQALEIKHEFNKTRPHRHGGKKI